MRAVDPRPARTRAQILASIEALATEGHEITVAAIVQRAQISRSTFYAQFADIGDVAVQLFQEIHNGIMLFEAEVRKEKGAQAAAAASLHALLEELEARRFLYAAVLGPAASSQTIRKVRNIMAEGSFKAMTHGGLLHIDNRVAATFIGAGVFAVVIDWLLDAQPRPGEAVAADLLQMIPQWLTDPQQLDQ